MLTWPSKMDTPGVLATKPFKSNAFELWAKYGFSTVTGAVSS